MNDNPIENAWKIHAALVDWTGKVDTKASFTLTIESALLAGVMALSGENRALSNLCGLPAFLYVVGISLLVVAVCYAVLVVRPRLRSKNLTAEARQHYIYFGHLRKLKPSMVRDHLENTPVLPVLSKQLVEMSKIAWDKHKMVQRSMTIAPLGLVALLFAAALSS